MHGIILRKWNSLVKNRAKEQTVKQNTNYKVQIHLGIIVPVSLGNKRASLTRKQLCQCHLRTIVPVSLENNCASLTWEQLYQCHLRTIVPMSLRDNFTTLTLEQSHQSHLGITITMSLGYNKTQVSNKFWTKFYYLSFFCCYHLGWLLL